MVHQQEPDDGYSRQYAPSTATRDPLEPLRKAVRATVKSAVFGATPPPPNKLLYEYDTDAIEREAARLVAKELWEATTSQQPAVERIAYWRNLANT